MSTSESMVRMLTLLPWLRAHGPSDVAAVADHFGISEAQLLQELAVLTFVGPGQGGGELVDISYEAGGTVAVHDSQGLEFPLRLSTAEAVSLITGLTLLTELPASRDAVAAATSALAKLEEAADAAVSGASAAVVVQHQDVDPGIKSVISGAIESGTRIHMQYAGAAREALTEREIDPLRLLAMNGHWYVEGWCHAAEAVRTFRLDRIVTAVATDLPASEHTAADESAGRADMLPAGADVRLHLLRSAEHVTELQACVAHSDLPDGTIDATVRVADEGWLVRLVLALGAEGRVVDDEGLEQAVADRARAALAAYES